METHLSFPTLRYLRTARFSSQLSSSPMKSHLFQGVSPLYSGAQPVEVGDLGQFLRRFRRLLPLLVFFHHQKHLFAISLPLLRFAR